jgi:dTDP-4-dehydrorhamnose reductase
LVYISTDYVFGQDEKRKKPYKETDNTGPINVYGVSKLAGEKFTQYICSKYFIVRVCGLFGVAGSSGKGGNFVELMVRLGKEKGEVSVVDDQILTPTYTKNIAENLQELLKTDYYGLYHLTSEGQCSWWEFANEIFKLLKLKVKNNPVDSKFFKTRAKRPKFSVLEKYHLNKINLNLMRDWKENLRLYLIEKCYLK